MRLTLQIFSSAVFGAPAEDKRAHRLVTRHPGRGPRRPRWSAGLSRGCRRLTLCPVGLGGKQSRICASPTLTVVVNGLRHHGRQLHALACGLREGGLEAEPHRVQVKLLLPHLGLRNCRERQRVGGGGRAGARRCSTPTVEGVVARLQPAGDGFAHVLLLHALDAQVGKAGRKHSRSDGDPHPGNHGNAPPCRDPTWEELPAPHPRCSNPVFQYSIRYSGG